MKPMTIKQRLTAAFSVLFDAANPTEIYRRPFEARSLGTISEEVNSSDRQQLLSDSEKIYANLGPAKGAIDQKATLAIGRAWLPRFEGQDAAWGAEARAWLLEQWYPLASIGGEDFQTALYLQSISVDREGDVGMVLTEYDGGFPAIQLIPGQSIGQRNADKIIKTAPYSGLRCFDGVAINENGQSVAYQILGPDSKGKDDKWISARDMALLKEPQYIGQYRGLPAFAHALLDLKNMRQVQGYEQMAAALASSIGILEWNEHGMPDLSNPAIGLNNTTTVSGGLVTESREGGTIRYMKAGTGAKIEAFKSDRPGEGFERLMNRFLRNACAGAGWPYEMAWDMASLGGVNSRIIIAMAQRAINDRQDLIRPHAKRAVGYAVAKAIKNGMLPANDEWWRWGFTMPARLTSDYGRDKAQDREDYLNGIINLSDICEERGELIDDFIARRKADNEKLEAADLPLPMTPQQAAADAAEAAQEAKGNQQQNNQAQMSALSARHAETLAALAAQPAPSITIHQPEINIAPPGVTIHHAAQTINVEPAEVTIEPAKVEMSSPQITVNVPKQDAPIVNLHIPKQGERKILRDESGRAIGLSEG
jgi:hypothetical protein